MPLMIEPWVDSNLCPKMSKSLAGNGWEVNELNCPQTRGLRWRLLCGRLLNLHKG